MYLIDLKGYGMSDLTKLIERITALEEKVLSLTQENDLLFCCLADVIQDLTSQNAFIPQLLPQNLGDYKDASLFWENRIFNPKLRHRQLGQSHSLALALNLGFEKTPLKDVPPAKKTREVLANIERELYPERAD